MLESLALCDKPASLRAGIFHVGGRENWLLLMQAAER
jgi:hypothetical protein